MIESENTNVYSLEVTHSHTHTCIFDSVSSCLFFLPPLPSLSLSLFTITSLKDTNVKVSNRSLCAYLQSLCSCWKPLQVSMFGYKPDPKSDRITPYTEENCEFSLHPTITLIATSWTSIYFEYLIFDLSTQTISMQMMLLSVAIYFPIWRHRSSSDILQGRSICRALWDYYKISGISVTFVCLFHK